MNGAAKLTPIFVDTHVLIWLSQGQFKRFSAEVISLIEASHVFYSPIAKLELYYLFERKKIEGAPEKIISNASKMGSLRETESPFSHVCKVAHDLTWTRDPFDRLIVAEAKLHKGVLLTADTTIQRHFKGALW